MKKILCLALCCGIGLPTSAETPAPAAKPVRVAVINGMMMTGLWPKVTEMFEAESGYKVEIAATGERPVLDPRGDWLIKDESKNKFEILQFARQKGAYVIVGRIPARMGRMPAEGMDIMVEGDPAMRRPFIVMEANPKKISDANVTGARALSDFLLSPKVQNFLAEFGAKEHGGLPLFYPVARSLP
jgi:ABC-type tungstate transport system permease subunit